MIDKEKAFNLYYEVFWVIHQNYNIEDDAETLCSKLDGCYLDKQHNTFNVKYGRILVTVVKIPGAVPKVEDIFECWTGNGYYLLNIR